jgi:hypothetical protein
MRKYLFLLLLGLIGINNSAQNSGVSFELHYPIIIPDSKNYVDEANGIIGGSVQFQFSNSDLLNYGIKYKFDQIASRVTFENTSTVNDLNFLTHHINLFGNYNLDRSETIKAVLESGITFYKYKNSSTNPAFFGFNISPGLNVQFHEKFYGLLNYSYVKTSLKQKQTNFRDRETMQFVRIGFGFKL